MVSSEEVAVLVYEQRRILDLMEALYNELAGLERSLLENRNALEILNKYRSDAEVAGHETLLPIGGGVYLPVSISRPDKIIVGVGAGIYLEKDLDSAIELVNKSIDNLRKVIQDRTNLLTQLRNRYEEITARLAEIQFKMQQRGRER